MLGCGICNLVIGKRKASLKGKRLEVEVCLVYAVKTKEWVKLGKDGRR